MLFQPTCQPNIKSSFNYTLDIFCIRMYLHKPFVDYPVDDVIFTFLRTSLPLSC
jgi:hypothetical protein